MAPIKGYTAVHLCQIQFATVYCSKQQLSNFNSLRHNYYENDIQCIAGAIFYRAAVFKPCLSTMLGP